VATIDEDFRALLEVPRVGQPAADQLRHAASALAALPADLATSITSTRRVPEAQMAEFASLAARLAAMYGLAVSIEPGDPVTVRFSRMGRE
jgi:hypothetical protein